MDTALYANPNCHLCKGKGRVSTGEHLGQEAICFCVLIGKRNLDAQRIIERYLPERAASMTLENYNPGGDPRNEHALSIAQNFVDNYAQAAREGWLLGFWGLTSSGKTHLTLGIAQECVRRYLIKPFLLNVPIQLRQERERFNSSDESRTSPIDKAAHAELLILDDLGSEYHRQGASSNEVSWVYEQLYIILEERIMACRPTLFSSNFSPSDMVRRMDNEAGKRVLSRIERAQVAPALEVFAVPGANKQTEEAEKRLFAPRYPKDFEIHNLRSGARKRYDHQNVVSIVERAKEKFADEADKHITVTRVMRDGEPVKEHLSLNDFLQIAGE